ncbi:MAG: two-component system response regulator [Candidatus Rokuibacteriota bacterium]|nr:MAG: two-component system response regulator [Candidatus Rokubacteria bacterium]
MTVALARNRANVAYGVLVVEDNAAVAALHCRLIDAMPGFQTVGVVSSGEAAYRAIGAVRPDVAIVDLTMPGGDGLTLLRRIRSEANPLEVIVVTASRDAQTIRETMHLGVVDYLVKPFAPERLRQSFNAFALRARALKRPLLAQEQVDLVQASGAARIQRLPKGLKRSTLRAVREALERSDAPLSADEVGQEAGIARVTARRYLEYLDVIGLARVERECHGPGRPRNRYRRVLVRSSA